MQDKLLILWQLKGAYPSLIFNEKDNRFHIQFFTVELVWQNNLYLSDHQLILHDLFLSK